MNHWSLQPLKQKLKVSETLQCNNDRLQGISKIVKMRCVREHVSSAIDSHRVPAEKGFNSIVVINTDILVFGEILSNTITIFMEDKRDELNNWYLLSTCITTNNEFV